MQEAYFQLFQHGVTTEYNYILNVTYIRCIVYDRIILQHESL